MFSDVLPRRQFLTPQKKTPHLRNVTAVLFDVDGTVRKTLSGSPFPRDPNDVVILPSVADRIAELRKMGFKIVFISNQAGVGLGQTTHNIVQAAMTKTIRDLQKENPEALVDYYDYEEDMASPYRKPNPGMVVRLLGRLVSETGSGLQSTDSFVVGDSAYRKAKNGRPADIRPDGSPGTDASNVDRLLAERLNMGFIEAGHFFGWETQQEIDSHCWPGKEHFIQHQLLYILAGHNLVGFNEAFNRYFNQPVDRKIVKSFLQNLHPDKIGDAPPYLKELSDSVTRKALVLLKDLQSKINPDLIDDDPARNPLMDTLKNWPVRRALGKI